jgi:hypothetical protein
LSDKSQGCRRRGYQRRVRSRDHFCPRRWSRALDSDDSQGDDKRGDGQYRGDGECVGVAMGGRASDRGRREVSVGGGKAAADSAG